MFGNESKTVETIAVQPGVAVAGDLSEGGVLRFERAGPAMQGAPEMHIIDGALILRYRDGTEVCVTV